MQNLELTVYTVLQPHRRSEVQRVLEGLLKAANPAEVETHQSTINAIESTFQCCLWIRRLTGGHSYNPGVFPQMLKMSSYHLLKQARN